MRLHYYYFFFKFIELFLLSSNVPSCEKYSVPKFNLYLHKY